jgi:hypothetical protein
MLTDNYNIIYTLNILENNLENFAPYLKSDINLYINYIICFFLFFMQILFIIGIFILAFTEDNTSIMGGLLIATYFLLFIFVIIKIIITCFATYNNIKVNTNKDLNIETNLYYSLRRLITTIPYDIVFIIIVSTLIAGFESISKFPNIITKMFMVIGIIIGIIILLLFLIAFISRPKDKARILFKPLFYIVFYLVFYTALTLVLKELIKKATSLHIFDNKNINDVKNNDSNNIANNLQERFLIFKDNKNFNDESGSYYFLGILFLIFLLLFQVFLMNAFKNNNNDNIIFHRSIILLTSSIDNIYTYLEIPKDSAESLKYIETKYFKILSQQGGKKQKKH